MIRWRVSPIARGSSIRPQERSALAPIRDSDSPATSWRKLRATMTQQGYQQKTQSASRAAQGRQEWEFQADWLHPFKIYRYPLSMKLRGGLPQVDLSKAWRTFRVRGGYVFTTTMDGLEVDWTDQVYDAPYQQGLFTLTNGTAVDQNMVMNVIVPINTHYFYFWIELAADNSSATLRWGTNPTATTYTDSQSSTGDASWSSSNPWAGWPAPDSQHFLLGWVDTLSQARMNRAVPRNVQTTDILAAGGTDSCPYG